MFQVQSSKLVYSNPDSFEWALVDLLVLVYMALEDDGMERSFNASPLRGPVVWVMKELRSAAVVMNG
jgi:hypothetical protein